MRVMRRTRRAGQAHGQWWMCVASTGRRICSHTAPRGRYGLAIPSRAAVWLLAGHLCAQHPAAVFLPHHSPALPLIHGLCWRAFVTLLLLSSTTNTPGPFTSCLSFLSPSMQPPFSVAYSCRTTRLPYVPTTPSNQCALPLIASCQGGDSIIQELLRCRPASRDSANGVLKVGERRGEGGRG